jgi:twitching motility protein PilT
MRLNESVPKISLSELLRKLSELGGSDLHITTGSPPQVRVDGHLRPARIVSRAARQQTPKQLAYSVLTDAQKHRFEENLELDFSFGVKGLSRFVPTYSTSVARSGAVFRAIPYEIKAFEDLVCRVVKQLCEKPRGLILVTWTNRIRKVDHTRGDDRQDQSRSSRAHPDDRRSDRVSPQPQRLFDQPARR